MTKTQEYKHDLTIIILNYNSQFWLKKTLTSLKEEYLDKTKYKVKVIVVDNNSPDDSTTLIKRSFRWVELIELEENLGFAAGNNIALSKIDSKYGMLLNNDVEFTHNSNLDILIDLMEKKETKKAGMATPRLEFPTGEIDPGCHRGEPTLWASFTYMLGLEKLFPKSKLFGQYHQYFNDLATAHEIDACSGAAMIFRTELLEKVGLLDERFFMYAEDLDWCKRFRDNKYKIIYYPYVSLIHHKNKSGIGSKSKAISSKTKTYFYDTMLQYYDKHYQKDYPKWVRTGIKYLLKIKKG
ncbi:MAG: glycosyltransferase family 2 protein [Candidatus Pacebacteria bacterium]|nr:glycosyltransferase family 2 protein [Candidatus Paceibacterota bacterium]